MDFRGGFLADLLALQLLHTNLAHCLNNRRFSNMRDFFSSDAVLEQDTEVFVGVDNITRGLQQHVSPKVRFLFGAPYVSIQESGEATGQSLRITYSTDKQGAVVVVVDDVRDRYRVDKDDRWRIALRSVTRIVG